MFNFNIDGAQYSAHKESMGIVAPRQQRNGKSGKPADKPGSVRSLAASGQPFL
jgi:hypothetical protein